MVRLSAFDFCQPVSILDFFVFLEYILYASYLLVYYFCLQCYFYKAFNGCFNLNHYIFFSYMSSILILFQICLGILLNFSFTGQFSCFALKCKQINVLILYSLHYCQFLKSLEAYIFFLLFLLILIHGSFSSDLFVVGIFFCCCFSLSLFSPWVSFSLILIYSVLFSENQVNFNSFKEDLYFLLAVICFVGTTNSELLYTARITHFFILWSCKWHKFGSLIFMWPSFIYNLLAFFFEFPPPWMKIRQEILHANH